MRLGMALALGVAYLAVGCSDDPAETSTTGGVGGGVRAVQAPERPAPRASQVAPWVEQLVQRELVAWRAPAEPAAPLRTGWTYAPTRQRRSASATRPVGAT